MTEAMHNVEMEQVILGTLLLDPKAMHFVKLLSADDFWEGPHRAIFEAFRMAADEGRHASPVVLAPQFQGQRLGEITLAQYLGRLCVMATSRECMMDYVRALKELSGRRTLASMAQAMSEIAKSTTAPLPEFLDHVTRSCAEIMSGLRQKQVTSYSVSELNKAMLDRLKTPGPSHLLTTGLSSLDKKLGGFGRKEVCIIGARPGMGKTTLALSSMRQAAKRGVASLFLSQEMAGDPVSARLLSDAVFNSQTPIPYKKMLRKTTAPWEIERLDEMAAQMASLPIVVDEQTSLNVHDVAIKARQYADRLAQSGQTLGVIWIDHLGYMQSTDRYRGNKVYETGEITKGLRSLAKELNVAVNLLCQLSRRLEDRDDKRPQLPDLRDSGNIEEDADCVLLLYREANYLEKMKYDDTEKEIARANKLEAIQHILEVNGAKTRNGEIFTHTLFTDIGSNVVRDLA